MEVCPLCAAPTRQQRPYPGPEVDALRLNTIFVCEHCGAGTATPRPTQAALDAFYASGMYWHAAAGKRQRAHERSQAWQRVGWARRFVREGHLTVADIGAGHGGIPRALAGTGLRISRYAFVEPDPQAAEDIAALRLPFAAERADSLSGIRGPFDLMFFNHVLEHVAEPLRVLEQSVALLAPQGVAYVETPHADYRFKDDVFPHVFFFTPRSLGLLGERLGVRTLECESFGRLPAPRLTPVGVVQRLAARALPLARGRLERLLDRVVWRYAARGDGIWLRWIFSPGQARQGSGTNAR